MNERNVFFFVKKNVNEQNLMTPQMELRLQCS